jgi:hypothetical protein
MSKIFRIGRFVQNLLNSTSYALHLHEDICKLKDTLDNVLERFDLQE